MENAVCVCVCVCVCARAQACVRAGACAVTLSERCCIILPRLKGCYDVTGSNTARLTDGKRASDY